MKTYTKIISLLAAALLTSAAQAALITLQFSGTYDTVYSELEDGEVNIPFSYTISFDTNALEQLYAFAPGDPMGGNGDVAGHAWYGYSAEGIVSTAISFGDVSWTQADLEGNPPAYGVEAQMWFDTDLTIETPTRAWMSFDNAEEYLNIGGSYRYGNQLEIVPEVLMTNSDGYYEADSFTITVVPEPSTFGLLAGAALLGFAGMRRRRPS